MPKKLAICIFVCVAVLALLTPASGAKAAGAVTDTIGVYIGYFGWDEDQFVEKATFNWRELDDVFGGALTTHEHVYSYYSGNRTYLVAARGFYIRDLLELAGIDFGSISRIDFFTKDQTVGAYRSFTKSSLFDMPRYYFPNLAADTNTGNVYPYNGEDIYDGAYRVEPMLALEDYTEWDSVGSMFEQLYDNTMFSAGSRFHLFFGQLAPTEANTSSAAKYVYKLFITFSGTPVLSADETNIDLKVGSDFRMTVNVSAEDSILDEYVRNNLTWSSSDAGVVSVDSTGALTVKSEGEAVITASFGSSSVSVAITASKETVETEITEITGTAGSGGEATTGEESGGGNAPETGGERHTNAEEQHEEITYRETPEEATSEENIRSLYMLSPEFISRKDFEEWVKSVLNREYIEGSDNGAINNARREGMDEDARQLVLMIDDKNNHMAVTAIALGTFFAFGFGYGIVSYRRAS